MGDLCRVVVVTTDTVMMVKVVELGNWSGQDKNKSKLHYSSERKLFFDM